MPVMNGYHMSCCDCGLVHTISFKAIRVLEEKGEATRFQYLPKKEYRVVFKLFRNNKLTKQERNKTMNKEQRKFKKVVKSRVRHAGKVIMAKEQVVARKNKILKRLGRK